MIWLDLQPQSSVVFLCFGSMGYFDEKQVMEIAIALGKSKQRVPGNDQRYWESYRMGTADGGGIPPGSGRVCYTLRVKFNVRERVEWSAHGDLAIVCRATDEIESGIRKMMAMEGEEIEVMRKQVKEMMEKSREVVVEGGSSYTAIGALVNNIIDNIENGYGSLMIRFINVH
ncbi:hypothetical protein LIER_39674 [Lithospermum erythrorhizon]|uniref:Uncharacterized protein n=1 Tax=Lithospermum erythrorhizon TaxID=34254 RepID=A0AAV3QMT3_LITER